MGTEEEPEKLRRAVRVNKVVAAEAQISAAVWLWFHGKDPISIHALAVGAHDCFHAMAKFEGKPSAYGEWIRQQSKTFQKREREAQNFFKHGLKNLKGSVLLYPIQTEFLIMDSVMCYLALFRSLPPLLRVYGARFAIEHLDILGRDFRPYFLKGLEKVEELGCLERLQFLNVLMPRFSRQRPA